MLIFYSFPQKVNLGKHFTEIDSLLVLSLDLSKSVGLFLRKYKLSCPSCLDFMLKLIHVEPNRTCCAIAFLIFSMHRCHSAFFSFTIRLSL